MKRGHFDEKVNFLFGGQGTFDFSLGPPEHKGSQNLLEFLDHLQVLLVEFILANAAIGGVFDFGVDFEPFVEDLG